MTSVWTSSKCLTDRRIAYTTDERCWVDIWLKSLCVMAADFVACHCRKCDQNCCTSTNDWIELDSGHRTYRDPNVFTNTGMHLTGQRKPGVKDFQDCYCQSLNCARCEERLGFTCVMTSREKTPYRQVQPSFFAFAIVDPTHHSLTLTPFQ